MSDHIEHRKDTKGNTISRTAPAIWVVLFAFLLNFVWEMWQIPFYEGMMAMPHWEGVRFCTWATAGDAGIAVTAYWIVAVVLRSRRWLLELTFGRTAAYVVIGLAITIVLEFTAVHVFERWGYAPIMPTIPLLGIGLLPVLQWLILPPLVLKLAQGQARR